MKMRNCVKSLLIFLAADGFYPLLEIVFFGGSAAKLMDNFGFGADCFEGFHRTFDA